MTDILDHKTSPPPELLYRNRLNVRRDLRDLWGNRRLVRTLAERDIRASYKQSFFGFGWAIVTPLLTVLVFTIFFKRIGKINTGDIPYPLFAYVGLLPWSFFTSSVSSGSGSLIFNSTILNKVYCPREVFPVAAILVEAVDTVLATAVLGLLFLYYGTAPRLTSLWVPVLILVQLALTVGLTLAFSTAVVYVRDLKQVLGGILQMGLFLTPVAWGIRSVPGRWRAAYCAIDPLAAVIDGYRRVVLQGKAPAWNLLLPAAATSMVVLIAGYYIFRRLEGGIADVA
ncbi:MAG: ABC transporter permease [Actinobacteria bacterium]|nr:MAG: ABC transporter permease [Actinomycetota bacterium]